MQPSELEPEPQPPAAMQSAGEWTVVQRSKPQGKKRGRGCRSTHRHSRGGKSAGVPGEQVDASRASLASDPIGEHEIQRAVMQMHRSVESMRSSAVAQHAVAMVRKLEAPQEMVCYGIGDIVNSRIARLQLALALFIANEISLDRAAISFYDPVLTHGGAKVLDELGVTVTQENVHCRRKVPDGGHSLFFMPHCDREMYNNVVSVNTIDAESSTANAFTADSGHADEAESAAGGDWSGVPPFTDGGSICRSSNLSFRNLSILGNSFSAYAERAPYDEALQRCEHLLIAASRCVEQPLRDAGEEFGPGVFNDTALHTFS